MIDNDSLGAEPAWFRGLTINQARVAIITAKRQGVPIWAVPAYGPIPSDGECVVILRREKRLAWIIALLIAATFASLSGLGLLALS